MHRESATSEQLSQKMQTPGSRSISWSKGYEATCIRIAINTLICKSRPKVVSALLFVSVLYPAHSYNSPVSSIQFVPICALRVRVHTRVRSVRAPDLDTRTAAAIPTLLAIIKHARVNVEGLSAPLAVIEIRSTPGQGWQRCRQR